MSTFHYFSTDSGLSMGCHCHNCRQFICLILFFKNPVFPLMPHVMQFPLSVKIFILRISYYSVFPYWSLDFFLDSLHDHYAQHFSFCLIFNCMPCPLASLKLRWGQDLYLFVFVLRYRGIRNLLTADSA